MGEDIEARLRGVEDALRVVEDTLACWQLRTEWEYVVDIIQSSEVAKAPGKDPAARGVAQPGDRLRPPDQRQVEDALDHLMSLMTEDAVLAITGAPVEGAYRGQEGIRNYFKNVRLGGPPWKIVHTVMQPLIKINGDSATARWLVLAYVQKDGSDTAPTRVVTECNDEYQRSGEEWKIKQIGAYHHFENFGGTPWATRPTGLPPRSRP